MMQKSGSEAARKIARTTTSRAIQAITLFLVVVGTITLAGDFYFLTNLRKSRKNHRSQKLVSTARTHSSATLHDRSVVANLLRDAGATVKDESKLPTLGQIADLYGPRPVILGLEHCERFRTSVPASERMLGAAGMFSTGTNLVTHLLKKNCYIPERAEKYGLETATKEQLGMRWQVPWGKHTPADYKIKHATEKAQQINKDLILPCVTIRSPWRWMQSMCKNPYTARWPHANICPHLVVNASESSQQWNPVSVKYGAGTENYTSLVHLWIEWYGQYARLVLNDDFVENQSYPVLIIRMEDLIFYTQETVTQICQCAGGVIYADKPFEYVVESAKKDSPGHDTSIGLTEAWIKYSKPLQPHAGFVPEDYLAGIDALNHDDLFKLVELLHYHHPPSD